MYEDVQGEPVSPPQGGSIVCSLHVSPAICQEEGGTVWTYCSAHRANSNQEAVSTDFVHTGLLVKLKLSPAFSQFTR